MAVISDPINSYSTNFESVRDDVISGINEGFKEGIKEGVEKGFRAGIKDCLNVGFFGIDKSEIKSYRKILEDAFGNASKKSIRSFVKKNMRKKYESTIDPIFKKYMEKACDTLVEEVRTSSIQLERSASKDIKKLIAFSASNINKVFGVITNKVRKELPMDIIFASAVEGLQEGFQVTINENVKICEQRLNREIDNKIISGET